MDFRSPTTGKDAPVSNLICQKYIEQPMIIGRRKFDIRQWVVVTSWEAPRNMRAWMYDDFYLRFGARDYDCNSCDPYIHLTNNAVTKLCPDNASGKEVKSPRTPKSKPRTPIGNRKVTTAAEGESSNLAAPGKNKSTSAGAPARSTSPAASKRWIDETMWTSEQFYKYLREYHNQHQTTQHGAGGSTTTRIEPGDILRQIKEYLWITLHSVQKKVPHREDSFEIFGFDFMVDGSGKLWLIEVNSAPDLSFSTSTTKELVTGFLQDVALLVTKYETNRNRNGFKALNQIVCQGGVKKAGKLTLLTQEACTAENGRLLGLDTVYAAYRDTEGVGGVSRGASSATAARNQMRTSVLNAIGGSSTTDERNDGTPSSGVRPTTRSRNARAGGASVGEDGGGEDDAAQRMKKGLPPTATSASAATGDSKNPSSASAATTPASRNARSVAVKSAKAPANATPTPFGPGGVVNHKTGGVTSWAPSGALAAGASKGVAVAAKLGAIYNIEGAALVDRPQHTGHDHADQNRRDVDTDTGTTTCGASSSDNKRASSSSSSSSSSSGGGPNSASAGLFAQTSGRNLLSAGTWFFTAHQKYFSDLDLARVQKKMKSLNFSCMQFHHFADDRSTMKKSFHGATLVENKERSRPTSVPTTASNAAVEASLVKRDFDYKAKSETKTSSPSAEATARTRGFMTATTSGLTGAAAPSLKSRAKEKVVVAPAGPVTTNSAVGVGGCKTPSTPPFRTSKVIEKIRQARERGSGEQNAGSGASSQRQGQPTTTQSPTLRFHLQHTAGGQRIREQVDQQRTGRKAGPHQAPPHCFYPEPSETESSSKGEVDNLHENSRKSSPTASSKLVELAVEAPKLQHRSRSAGVRRGLRGSRGQLRSRGQVVPPAESQLTVNLQTVGTTTATPVGPTLLVGGGGGASGRSEANGRDPASVKSYLADLDELLAREASGKHLGRKVCGLYDMLQDSDLLLHRRQVRKGALTLRVAKEKIAAAGAALLGGNSAEGDVERSGAGNRLLVTNITDKIDEMLRY